MPKPIDTPGQLTGQDRVELAAEPTSQDIHDMIKSSVQDAFGAVRTEMLAESKAKAAEAAKAVLDGKPDDATPCDPTNVYGKDFVEFFRGLVQPAAVAEEVSPVRSMAKAAWYLYRARGNPRLAAEDMAKELKGTDLEVATKALGIDDFTAGGALLQGDMFEDVVPELLSETAIVSDSAFPRVGVNGQVEIPYEVTGPTTRSVEENAAANASEPTFDQLLLVPRTKIIVVPASKKMLRTVRQGAAVIERSMKRSLAVDLDYDLIRGTGASSTQHGLRYLANSSNLLNVNGTVSAQNTVTDLLRLQEALQNSNAMHPIRDCRYAISPRIWRYLAGLRDNDGYLFRQEMLTEMSLMGAPLAGQSGRGITAIPEDLAVTDTSESEIYFYGVPGMMLGIDEDMRIEMSDTAAYNNSAGTVVSAFSKDQVVWKLVTGIDQGSVQRGHNIAVLIDVDWGV